jgi:serine/threonine protein kinase
MKSPDNQRAIEVFEAALEREPAERRAHLDETCRDDSELRAEVESLLAADERARGFLEPPEQTTPQTASDGDPLVGTTVGRYHVTRVIAAGGMGTVYEAVQEEPHRTVALKVIRAGMASRSALRRFKHESEILGRLRHPGIAQIYEAGTHGGEHGPPYFAMEYVPGALAITRYAEAQRLSTRRRLELFVKVCEAVHAGHQRGIIHRDLKPANVLVDESGQPKLIDFGVARATDADLTIATLQTDVGELVGTLRYMSPEQCEGDASEVDTRCDVYALGVVLFELLTGELPYDFSSASPFDVPRVIREQEPRRMSAVNRMLRGDMETVVLKALEKDRGRRYQSVPELTRDIQHYLNNEPIEAKRGRRWYVFCKTLRRHRIAAVAVVSFAVLLSVFALSVFVLYQRSQAQADTAQQVINVLNRTLTQADPYAGEGGDALRVLLDKTAAQLKQGLVQDPKVRAAVQRTLGTAYMNLGRYDEGGEQLRAAYEAHREIFGDHHVETAESCARLAVWQYMSGDYVAAENALREAIPILRQYKDERRSELGRSLGRLSMVLMYQQRPTEGETAAREFLQVAEEIPGDPDGDIATAANFVSIMLQEQGRLAEAKPFLRRALERDRARYGDAHPRVARDLQNLAILQRKLGDYSEAENSMRGAIRIAEETVSEESPDHAFTTQDLANILADQGRTTEAGELHLKALAVADQQLDDSNPRKADVYAGAAEFFLNAGEAERALRLAQRAETIGHATLPPEHPNTALHSALIGRCLSALGRFEEAETRLVEAQAALRDDFGLEDERTQEAVRSLIELYEHTDNLEQARKYRSLTRHEKLP